MYTINGEVIESIWPCECPCCGRPMPDFDPEGCPWCGVSFGCPDEDEDLPPVLDACCGSRMFWFDRDNPVALYMDNRSEDHVLCDGRTLSVRPDVVADFRDMPFPDKSFDVVIFDSPHCVSGTGFMVLKYGRLDVSWREDLRRGFSECWRVLRDRGVLIFKWSEPHIKYSRVADLFPAAPLIGNCHSGTIWTVFYKEAARCSGCSGIRTRATAALRTSWMRAML